ncbi:cytochrome P450 [Melanogaster broomeanus]|nr:cytochrome P450 [Melanogaster broomeanus]
MNLAVAVGLTAAVLVYFFAKRFTRPSLSSIPGPNVSSFLLGNLGEIFQAQVGETDFKWQSRYGNIIRFKGILGENHLMVADPKALQWIFNTYAHHYPKPPNRRIMIKGTTGKGLLWADGETHKRQKKVLLPGFGGLALKTHLTIFKRCAESMTAKWTETIRGSSGEKAIIDVSAWLSLAILDAIGEAAFDARFGALEDDRHILARGYRNIMKDVYGYPSVQQLFIQEVLMHIPAKVLEWIREHSSNPRLQRMRNLMNIVTDVAKEMVQEKAESLLQGTGSRDIFSLLIKANMDTDAKNKLADDELFAQMRTILIAGHETTLAAITWAILEIARHPDIRKTEADIRSRGDSDFTMADFEAMPYTTAVIKEVLRYHSVAYHIFRVASRDDILPLSKPITTKSGDLINELPVPKGTRILVSIAAYNRITELWGEDAHEFNPDRWLEGIANDKKHVSVGVYSNLMTFLGGARACIGWQFAVIEMQAFLVEMVGKFEFAMTDNTKRIRREAFAVMTPMFEGETDGGVQLPLAVSIAPHGQSDAYSY